MFEDPLAGLRIGAVSYLNTKPLIHSLESRALRLEVPARLAARFLAGELDAALLPVFAILEAGGGDLVDDVAIACRGEVFSVIVASQGEFSEAKEIYLDPSSRSSSALLRVLSAEFYPGCHRLLESTTIPEGAARLLIGDPAIAFRREHGASWTYHDLGALWLCHTGLSFVFAVWALAAADRQVGDAFRTAKEDGLQAREEIAASCDDPEFVRRYLSTYIQFDLGLEEKEGLKLFERLARKHGVLPQGEPAEISWI